MDGKFLLMSHPIAAIMIKRLKGGKGKEIRRRKILTGRNLRAGIMRTLSDPGSIRGVIRLPKNSFLPPIELETDPITGLIPTSEEDAALECQTPGNTCDSVSSSYVSKEVHIIITIK